MLPVQPGASSGTVDFPSKALAKPAPSRSATWITSSPARMQPAPTSIATISPALSTSAACLRSCSRGTTRGGVPREQDLRQAADVLNAGEIVAMLVGAGCMRAGDEVIQVADLLGAGFAKALLGKSTVPDEAPGCTGSIGLLGTKASWELMSGCDTLLMVGSSFPYSEFLPKEGHARGVQIDLKARMLGIRYPMEVHLHGDAAETLRALLPYLKKKANRSWRQKMEAEIREWKRIREAQARVTARPLNPAYVFWELNPRIPDRAIFTVDTGSAAAWYARYLDLGAGMMGSLSGNLATMGPAMPYAIAAKFAYPD